MKPVVNVIRSIGAEFASRLYSPVLITVGIITFVLLAISIWLVTVNQWWWILFGIVCVAIFIAAVVLLVLWIVIKTISPTQTKAQKQQVKAFVDKMQRLAEVTSTPKAMLLFKVMRDMVKPRENSFIMSVSNDTQSLKRDFMAIRDSFQQGS